MNPGSIASDGDLRRLPGGRQLWRRLCGGRRPEPRERTLEIHRPARHGRERRTNVAPRPLNEPAEATRYRVFAGPTETELRGARRSSGATWEVGSPSVADGAELQRSDNLSEPRRRESRVSCARPVVTSTSGTFLRLGRVEVTVARHDTSQRWTARPTAALSRAGAVAGIVDLRIGFHDLGGGVESRVARGRWRGPPGRHDPGRRVPAAVCRSCAMSDRGKRHADARYVPAQPGSASRGCGR